MQFHALYSLGDSWPLPDGPLRIVARGVKEDSESVA